MSLSLTVTGLNEQIIRFKQIVAELQPPMIGEIINFGLAQIEQEAKAKAPVLTGRLRDSIVHYMLNEMSGEVAATAPYAAAQEFGFIRGGKRFPGKKYFAPAVIHGIQIIRDLLNQYIASLAIGKPALPHASQGVKGSGQAAIGGAQRGGGAHKYLQKINTGAGIRYVYAKTTQRTKARIRLKPGGRKSPGTSFQRPKTARSHGRR